MCATSCQIEWQFGSGMLAASSADRPARLSGQDGNQFPSLHMSFQSFAISSRSIVLPLVRCSDYNILMPPINTIDSEDSSIYNVTTKAPGPSGTIPITGEMLLERPSGDIFGLTQNAGMVWDPTELGRDQYLILSTQGGIRAPDGTPIALGYHTGHWEVGLLMQ